MAVNYSPPSVAEGQRTTLDILQAGRKPDVALDVTRLEPNTVPLLRLTSKLAKRKTINPKFTWFEDQVFPYWTYADAASNSGSTTLVLPAGHGKFVHKGTMLYVVAGTFWCRVRAVSVDTLTIERAVHGVDANILDKADLRLIGTAFSEGSGSVDAKATLEVEKFNYTQIFKVAMEGTGTEEASLMWWGKDRKRQRHDRGVDQAIDMESAFLLGERDKWTDPDTGKVVRTMRGLLTWVTSNVTAAGGALSETLMDTIVQETFRYHSASGRGSKWAFVGALAEIQIGGFARTDLRLRPRDKTFGINITTYQAVGHSLDLIRHNLLEDNPLSAATQTAHMGGMMLIIDPETPRYRYMEGRDNVLQRDIQDNDVDGWKDQYHGEIGLEVIQEQWCHKVTGIT